MTGHAKLTLRHARAMKEARRLARDRRQQEAVRDAEEIHRLMALGAYGGIVALARKWGIPVHEIPGYVPMWEAAVDNRRF